MSTTVIHRDGARMVFTVTCGDAEKAKRGMALVADIIADEGAEKLRVTFENITVVLEDE